MSTDDLAADLQVDRYGRTEEAAEFDRWLTARDAQVRAEVAEQIAQATTAATDCENCGAGDEWCLSRVRVGDNPCCKSCREFATHGQDDSNPHTERTDQLPGDITIECLLSADGRLRQTNGRSLDRWLAARDAQVRAEVTQAVRDLHRHMGIYEPCPDPAGDCTHDHFETDGGEFVHGDELIRWACTSCRDEDGDPLDYPCPTISALEDR